MIFMPKFFIVLFLYSFCFSQSLEEAFELKTQMKFDDAIKAFEKINDPNKHLYISQIYESQELYSQAISEINKFIDLNKNDISAKIYLGQVLFKSKQFNLLISNFERLNEAEHNDQSLFLLGLAYQETRNLPFALETFKKVLALNPNHLKAIYKMGVFNAQIQNYAQAYEFINKGLSLAKINIDLLSLKAQVDFATEKWTECINTVMLLNSLGYKTENQYFMMAKSYTQIKQYKNAIEYYNLIIDEFETTNASVYHHLGLSYGYNKQFDLAEKNLLKAIDMKQVTFETDYYYLGEFTKETSPKKAINYYKKAIAEKPDMFYAHYQLLMIDLDSKDKKTQLKLIENFKNKHKDMPKEYADFFNGKIQYLKREIHLE